MIPIAAKPTNKAEMVRIAKASDPSLTEEQIAAKLGLPRDKVQQALKSRGLPLKRGLRS